MEKSFGLELEGGLEDLSAKEAQKVGIDLDTAQFAEKPLEPHEIITLPDGTTVGREAFIRTRFAEIAARLTNEQRTFWEKLSGQNKLTAMDMLHAEALIEDAERTETTAIAHQEQANAKARVLFEQRKKQNDRLEAVVPEKPVRKIA